MACGDLSIGTTLDNNDSGMYDVTIINDIIGMIDRKTSVRTTKMGQKIYVVRQVDEEEFIRELYHVKSSQDVAHMLLSITRDLSHGAHLSSIENKDIIVTYRDCSKIVCDRRLETKDGWVPGVELIQITAMASIVRTLLK